MARTDAPIGVFDSGVGGLSVLRALRAELPAEHFVYYADSAYAPYGERPASVIIDRTLAVAQHLVETHGVKALVVACNTATAAAIGPLRRAWPSLPVTAIEPALRPAAAMTRTGHVAVFATRRTVTSARFAALRRALSWQTAFHVVACDGLAAAIESDNAIGVIALCAEYARLAGDFGVRPGQIDTLVLGCTHYLFATTALRRSVGDGVVLLEPGGSGSSANRTIDRRGRLGPHFTRWRRRAPRQLGAGGNTRGRDVAVARLRRWSDCAGFRGVAPRLSLSLLTLARRQCR